MRYNGPGSVKCQITGLSLFVVNGMRRILGTITVSETVAIYATLPTFHPHGNNGLRFAARHTRAEVCSLICDVANETLPSGQLGILREQFSDYRQI